MRVRVLYSIFAVLDEGPGGGEAGCVSACACGHGGSGAWEEGGRCVDEGAGGGEGAAEGAEGADRGERSVGVRVGGEIVDRYCR